MLHMWGYEVLSEMAHLIAGVTRKARPHFAIVLPVIRMRSRRVSSASPGPRGAPPHPPDMRPHAAMAGSLAGARLERLVFMQAECGRLGSSSHGARL